MMENDTFIPEDWVPGNNAIKVLGVGGAGQNAVTYMFNNRIEGCTFVICNTDGQALKSSAVPIKIHIGKKRGAGCDPIKGRNAAEEDIAEIHEKVLGPETEMLFITAGMGGGTGTGASPVIAAAARKKGILTVGVVTLPFRNEGRNSLSRAMDGIRELEKYVDSLLIIDNEKLYTVYGDMLAEEAYPKVNQVLATAVQSILGIIQKVGDQNVDMEDVKTIIKDSGLAIMGIGTAKGEDRLREAVNSAVVLPLMNSLDMHSAKNMLVNIVSGRGENGVKMRDLQEVDNLIESYIGGANKFKRGLVYEDEITDGTVSITIIATGFKPDLLNSISDETLGNIIHLGADYEYAPEPVETVNEVSVKMIGPNDSRNEPIFHFDKAPLLSTYTNATIAKLENVSAITRLKMN